MGIYKKKKSMKSALHHLAVLIMGVAAMHPPPHDEVTPWILTTNMIKVVTGALLEK